MPQQHSAQNGTLPPYRGLQFETGIGAAIPFGDINGRLGALSRAVNLSLPIDVNLGYRFNARWAAGAYWVLAPSFVNNDFLPCEGIRCGGIGTRVGLHGQYHLGPDNAYDPWLGIGAGWQLLSIEEDIQRTHRVTLSRSDNFNGPVYLDARLGVDFGPSRTLRYGMYMGYTLGEFWTLVHVCDTCSPRQTLEPIEARTLHHWVGIGFQARLTRIR